MSVEFSAEVISSYTISVITNTYWNCKSEGNFKLSEYYGSGNTEIDIIIPDDVTYAEGFVYFSYGDERCSYPRIEIGLANLCYISSNPSYMICDGKKTIYLYYEDSGETFSISVFCYGVWNVSTEDDLKYITSDDGVMIISNGEDGEVVIQTNEQCEEKGKIHVKLIKKKADS
jgi:hypothetical protein